MSGVETYFLERKPTSSEGRVDERAGGWTGGNEVRKNARSPKQVSEDMSKDRKAQGPYFGFSVSLAGSRNES